MASKKKTIEFVKERDTKNTVRFAEVVADDDQPAIGTLYVQKFALKDLGAPEKLSITIAAA